MQKRYYTTPELDVVMLHTESPLLVPNSRYILIDDDPNHAIDDEEEIL